jgi:raffinose/stachyose/melibiose transport system substrate-binding protein
MAPGMHRAISTARTYQLTQTGEGEDMNLTARDQATGRPEGGVGSGSALARRVRRSRRHRPLAALILVGCVSVGLLAGCGGSSGSGGGATTVKAAKLDPSAAGGTLTQWNWETEADDPGGHALVPVAINEFEKQYPKWKVTNREMTLEEQTDSLPLSLNGSSAPDVTETNEGFGSMGRLVTDKLLLNLADYNKLYGWSKKVGTVPLQYNSFSADGKFFGQGNVYGVPWSAAPLGVFYNKTLLKKAGATIPTNWNQFFADLPLLKKAGITPMAYSGGQPTAYQPVHTFYMLADAFTPAATSINFVFHKGKNPSINVPGYVKAATTFQSWAKDGYLQPGYAGLSDTQALNYFTSGKAGFFIEGEWYISSVQSGLHDQAGFWEPPTITGGPGEGYSIPSKSSSPDAAAAFINILLGPKIQKANLKEGEVPVVPPSQSVLKTFPPMIQAATNGWTAAVKHDQLVPFLDYATPNYLNQEMAAVQELLGGGLAPKSMISQLQSDYEQYWQGKS